MRISIGTGQNGLRTYLPLIFSLEGDMFVIFTNSRTADEIPVIPKNLLDDRFAVYNPV